MPLVQQVATLVADPGLVVVHGGPGCGRSTLLHTVAGTVTAGVYVGGGLAATAGTAGFALSHALRVRLPVHDRRLLVDAVRARVGAGLLVLDDLHWADPLTLHTVTALAGQCRILAALRTPHRLPAATVDALRAAATGWLPVPPLDRAAAVALARRTAPALTPAAAAALVDRAGGTPLAVTALARHATARPDTGTGGDLDQVGYAVATACADLPRAARTALAVLGLLGRPAPAGLLGPGVADLTAAALTVTGADGVHPVSPYVAEVAAGLLDEPTRRALHRRLAGLLPPVEAVTHLAAAGDHHAAHRHALTAADAVDEPTVRAELLTLACTQAGVDPPPDVRVRAARAALHAARPDLAVTALRSPSPLGVHAAVLHAEALLQLGDPAGAARIVAPVPDTAPTPVLAARDRIRLLTTLAVDPPAAATTVAEVTARHGHRPADAGLRAALAALAAATGTPGWEQDLTAAADDPDTDRLAAAWSAWLLADTLAGAGRLAEAVTAADRYALRHGYGWSTRLVALRHWCTALRGDGTDATALLEATLHPVAYGYALAAAALVEADAGLLTTARARLAAAAGNPVVDWVAREAAWLDGQPAHAHAPLGGGAAPLIAGLHAITRHFAGATVAVPPQRAPHPVAVTLTAFAAARAGHRGAAADLATAADCWAPVARREQVRCLLAHATTVDDPDTAVSALTDAERIAVDAGLVVLAGQARRALRAHGATTGPAAGRGDGPLTDREQQVLRLVAQGEPSRRIAGRLGVSVETVETHVRAGMRKLGVRTRTAAAAMTMAVSR
ncbi:LuxR C-terminal-related transcriptional regulator [Micromonospora sp. CPCC 206060]|uniref:helix-turn-helix transcriptional regulator n=1 Tax=Micromonospora sp. CPCC 206060 TaxID=3122406 RepID=UPI002FF17555